MGESIGREGGSTATNLVCEICHFSKNRIVQIFFFDFQPKKSYFQALKSHLIAYERVRRCFALA